MKNRISAADAAIAFNDLLIEKNSTDSEEDDLVEEIAE